MQLSEFPSRILLYRSLLRIPSVDNEYFHVVVFRLYNLRAGDGKYKLRAGANFALGLGLLNINCSWGSGNTNTHYCGVFCYNGSSFYWFHASKEKHSKVIDCDINNKILEYKIKKRNDENESN